MHAAAELLLQGIVNQAVALNQRQALELTADHQNAEMGFGSRRNGVHVAFVVDLQVVGFEGLGQFGPDGPLHRAAGVRVHVRPDVSQRPGCGEAD